MKALLRLSRGIDRVNTFLGRAVRWLILAAILVSAINAVLRKALDVSSNAWLELQWYLFGAAYLIAASYTLLRNEHIRIDVIANHLGQRTRDWIDLIGHLIVLLPFSALMVREAVPFMLASTPLVPPYRMELSSNFGGLVIWPAKAFIVVGFALLFLQGISEVIKRIAALAGAGGEPAATGRPGPHA
jgi:TRAP-type mannitol/chloroaromatic compound transport system permease small subunit